MSHRLVGQGSLTDEGKGHFMTCLCRHRGEVEVLLQPIHNLCARQGWVVSATPQLLYPWERPGICICVCCAKRWQ
jgi:hypothetical protein